MLTSKLLQKAAFLKPNTASIRSVSSTLHITNSFNSQHRFSKSSTLFNNSMVVSSFSTVTIPQPPTSIHPHEQLSNANGSLIYTETDEAPALATFSLLPILSKVSIIFSPLNITILYLLPVSVGSRPMQKMVVGEDFFANSFYVQIT